MSLGLIGFNIKNLREKKNITLRDMAEKLKVSSSFLSQIETGKAFPSLVNLKNIADFLEVTVCCLFGEDNVCPQKDMIIKEKKRRVLANLDHGVSIHFLSNVEPNKLMEPMIVKIEKNGDSGNSKYKHFGQEFALVLKGSLELTLNTKVYNLKKGDSIYFNSTLPHSFKNTSNETTEVLWVDTPPTF